MSEIKVNKISPSTGTDLDLGDSGDSLKVPSGGFLKVNNIDVVAVAPSTSGNVLTSNGSAWASTAAAAGGKVLQALTGEVTAATASTTSNSWVDIAGMSVAITTAAASSKVFCIAQIRADGGMHWATRLVRNDGSSDTAVGAGAIVGSRYGASAGGLYRINDTNTQMESICMVLDNPPAGAAYTYKAQWCKAGSTLYLNRNSANQNTGGGASTSARDAHSYSAITVFEIGA